MRYANIIPHDVANGEGVRTSIFVSGCNRHCPGCFNAEAQDFNHGELYTFQTSIDVGRMIADKSVSGVSILGGEPMDQDVNGLRDLTYLCDLSTIFFEKTAWLWTGFLFEDIVNQRNASGIEYARYILLRSCTVVVDGPYIEELADKTLKWRGSSNQRIIDVKKSLKENEVVLWRTEQ